MDESRIVSAINKGRKGIAQYLEIMNLLRHVDVSRDRNIQRWYEQYLPTEEARRVIELFDREVIDHYKVTSLTKVDFVLWQIRA